jgi:predicted MFS family arabinose efflux permease
MQSFRESLALLATRRFGTFWVASLLSNIGTWAQQVAEPWLLLTLGATPFLIGVDSFAMNAPVLLLTVLGGALADGADRRRVIAIFQSIQMLCPVAIVVLLVTGKVEPWIVIALSLVVGVTDALSMPSFQSIVPSIVAPDRIDRGLALNSTQFNLSRILGPSLAGLLMSGAGMAACFAVSAVSYLPFIGVALWILPAGRPAARDGAALASAGLFSGLAEILRDRQLRCALLTVFASSVLCAPLATFIPVLIQQVFGGGAAEFSTAVTAFGIGALLGGVVLLGIAPRVDRGRSSSGFAAAWGAVLVLIALDPWSWAVPALLVLAGAAMTISNTAANTLLLAGARPHLLGRAVALYMLALRGGISLGSLLIGGAIGLLGVQHALLASGAAAIGIHLFVGRHWPRPAAA